MLRISINDYLTDYKLNLEYAEVQVRRAMKKIDRIIRNTGPRENVNELVHKKRMLESVLDKLKLAQ